MTGDVDWFGDRAVLVRLADARDRAAVTSLLTRVLADVVPRARVRPGMDAVLVEVRVPDPELLSVVRVALGNAAEADSASPVREVVLPARYDGADLADVAARLGATPADVVAAHTAQRWQVAFVGFAPGFAYLEPAGTSLLDWASVPRRESPRARVPAGSVAVAAGCSAVYPQDMPGGWALLGTSSVRLFDPVAADPALLHAGDRVRFVVEPEADR